MMAIVATGIIGKMATTEETVMDRTLVGIVERLRALASHEPLENKPGLAG
ncbi:MAG: hypothetical protein FD187_1937 [bacterium]|nr:MAG: hypothetical protein FD142_1671 [bacterium]KAF0148514.1 MAG: hypothetical protein FD187_1937 [bacterium]KAF0168058.1 MAG: hypothetical protein FD158_1785 [bacterium]TXT21196.1 MAG: hypothetical protein FD132_706 [bacterium]